MGRFFLSSPKDLRDFVFFMSGTKRFIHFVGKLQHAVMCCAGWCIHACVYLLALEGHCWPNKLSFLTWLYMQWSLLVHRCTWYNLFLLNEQAALEMLSPVS